MITKEKYILSIVIILLYVGLTNVHAQQQITWDDFVERYHSFDEDANDDITFEELLEIHNNKININNTSEMELSALPFLTISQIRDILYYISTNGNMASLGELLFITSLDKDTRAFMQLFCYAGNSPKKVTPTLLLKKARNEVIIRTDIPLYEQEAYKSHTKEEKDASQNKYYNGSNLYHSFRYKLNSMDHLALGIQAEKDMGEKGIDYISAYAQIQDFGCVQNAIIGNYKVSFGQGLVVNTGANFGKFMSLGQTDRMDKGITKHSSTSENNHFTGGGITLRRKGLLLSTYISRRNADGNISKDSTSITSLKTDGLHRTNLEASKKSNLGVTDFGGNIHWGNDNIQLSATIAFTHYSLQLMPKYNTKSSLYRYYNAKGKDFLAYSLSYGYRHKRWAILGETASSNKGGIASINSFHWNINSSNTLTLIQRYYSYKYVAINGNAFGENSSPQNEEGIFINWNNKSLKKTAIESHVDFYYFPWIKYQVSSSSHGFDWLLQISYSPQKTFDLSLRYKFKCKQKDFILHKSKDDTLKTLLYNRSHNIRFSCSYKATDKLTFKTTLFGTAIDFDPNSKEYGYAIGEQIQWQNTGQKIRFNLSATYFDTDTYNARIYSYEPSLLYSFGISSYYDKGCNVVAFASIPIISNIFLTGKIGTTYYFNKKTIGSGPQTINKNHKEYIQLQIRWKI